MSFKQTACDDYRFK